MINPLNDISRVYLEQVSESAVPGKPAEKLGAVSAIPQDEREAAKQRTLAKAAALRAKKGIIKEEEPDPFGRPGGKYGGVKKGGSYEKAHLANQRAIEKIESGKKIRKEALDPVGKEDSDIDNDGVPNTKKDKYLKHRRDVIKQEISTQKEAKEVKKWWDDDGDGIGYEEGEVSGKFKKKKKVKEGFSNWRDDLREVIDVVDHQDNDKEIVEKSVKNNDESLSNKKNENLKKIKNLVNILVEKYEKLKSEEKIHNEKKKINLFDTIRFKSVNDENELKWVDNRNNQQGNDNIFRNNYSNDREILFNKDDSPDKAQNNFNRSRNSDKRLKSFNDLKLPPQRQKENLLLKGGNLPLFPLHIITREPVILPPD